MTPIQSKDGTPFVSPSDLRPPPGPEELPLPAADPIPGAGYVAVALSTARAQHPEPPPGFEPLSLEAAFQIVETLRINRMRADRDSELELAFRPNGQFMATVRSLATAFPREDAAPGSYLVVTMHGPPHPAAAHLGRPRPTRQAWAAFDAKQVSDWYWRPEDGRCWKVGTPEPAELPSDDPAAAVALEPAVVRRIVKLHDQLSTDDGKRPGAARVSFPCLYDPATGDYMGHVVPVDRAAHTVITWASDAELLEEHLALVRVTPRGRVRWLAGDGEERR